MIIFDQADSLSFLAQQSLRSIIERHIRYNRFVFLANNEFRLLDAIRSRCCMIRLGSPTLPDFTQIFDMRMDDSLRASYMTEERLNNVFNKHHKHLKNALLEMQLDPHIVSLPTPERFVAGQLEQARRLHAANLHWDAIIRHGRDVFAVLLGQKVSPEQIVVAMVQYAVKKLKDEDKIWQICDYAEKYERMARKTANPFFSLEAFYVRFIPLILSPA